MSWDRLVWPIALTLLLSWLPGILAMNKGRSFLKYYFICLVSGLALVLLQPKLAEILTSAVQNALSGAEKDAFEKSGLLRFYRTLDENKTISRVLPVISVLLAPVVMTIVVILKKDLYHSGKDAAELKASGKRRTGVSYAKWGYALIFPFFVSYLIFSLVPQFTTIYNSFFENRMKGMQQIGPNYVGVDNFVKLFTPNKNGSIDILQYFGNTVIMWVLGAVPQILIALLLAVFFTSYRLNLKGQQFFKTVIYMPNLIMASAFAMLFSVLFSKVGPVNQILIASGMIDEVIDFLALKIPVRSLVALMNFLMWFGNTTILLMAGIQGIDQNMFEAAEIDGANSLQVFFRVTLPLLSPILVYTIITAMIGGLQMFDVPQVLTNGRGSPDYSTMTVVMNLNTYLGRKNYGMAGAVSVVLFIISAVLSLFVYRMLSRQYSETARKRDRV